jgi:hypothetical protein
MNKSQINFKTQSSNFEAIYYSLVFEIFSSGNYLIFVHCFFDDGQMDNYSHK